MLSLRSRGARRPCNLAWASEQVRAAQRLVRALLRSSATSMTSAEDEDPTGRQLLLLSGFSPGDTSSVGARGGQDTSSAGARGGHIVHWGRGWTEHVIHWGRGWTRCPLGQGVASADVLQPKLRLLAHDFQPLALLVTGALVQLGM